MCLIYKYRKWLKVKGHKDSNYANTNQKKIRSMSRVKERYSIIIRGKENLFKFICPWTYSLRIQKAKIGRSKNR